MFWAQLTHQGTPDVSLQTKPSETDIAGILPNNSAFETFRKMNLHFNYHPGNLGT
jgi:hypothetical protein